MIQGTAAGDNKLCAKVCYPKSIAMLHHNGQESLEDNEKKII
jgi:hypothetical protein